MTRQILVTQEEERKRISRELHDDLLQTLVSINLDLEILSKGISGDPQTLQKRIAGTRQSVTNALIEVHRFARELRPAELDDLGLVPALRSYTKQLTRQKRIKVHFSASRGIEALGDTERGILFRVAQEALTNVIRHACATQIKVNIAKIIGGIQLKISDNGKSFRVENYFLAKNPKRLGLVGMKERVEMIGGSLAIESKPGTGTTVRAKIPFTQS
jgi:signal transduction histidine kinase